MQPVYIIFYNVLHLDQQSITCLNLLSFMKRIYVDYMMQGGIGVFSHY